MPDGKISSDRMAEVDCAFGANHIRSKDAVVEKKVIFISKRPNKPKMWLRLNKLSGNLDIEFSLMYLSGNKENLLDSEDEKKKGFLWEEHAALVLVNTKLMIFSLLMLLCLN